MQPFDPYYTWLGIPPAEQPANHYRLLGISLFESNTDAISNAADRLMSHVRTFQSGKHAKHSQQILNEIAAARVTLLNAQKKARYDAELQGAMNSALAGSSSVLDDAPVIRTAGSSSTGRSASAGGSGAAKAGESQSAKRRAQDTSVSSDTDRIPLGPSGPRRSVGDLDDAPITISTGPRIAVKPKRSSAESGIHGKPSAGGQAAALQASSRLPLWMAIGVGAAILLGVVATFAIFAFLPGPNSATADAKSSADEQSQTAKDTSGADDPPAAAQDRSDGSLPAKGVSGSGGDKQPEARPDKSGDGTAGPKSDSGAAIAVEEVSDSQNFTPPSVAPQSWHDLLQTVDVSQDKFFGEWLSNANRGLQASPPAATDEANAPRNALLVLPIAPRAEYQLRTKLQFVEGENCAIISLPVGRRQVTFSIGARVGGKIRSGFERIKGQRLDQSPAWTSTIKPKAGSAHQLDLTVILPPTPPIAEGQPPAKPTAELYALWDGAPAAHWKGSLDDLSPLGEFAVPGEAAICLGSAASTVRFESVELGLLTGDLHYRREMPKLAMNSAPTPATPAEDTPAAPLPPEGIDLLPLIDLEQQVRRGEWSSGAGALESPANHQPAVLHIPARPPAEYRLEMVAQRISGDNALCIALPLGQTQMSAHIGGHGGDAICLVDDNSLRNEQGNPTYLRHSVFSGDNAVRLRLEVAAESVTIFANGEQVLQWKGDRSRVRPPTSFFDGIDKQQIALATWESKYRILDLRLLPLDAPASAGVPDSPSVAAALEVLRSEFSAEYDNAKKPEQKAALARSFVQAAEQARGNPPRQLALWMETQRLATEGGDVRLALETLNQRNIRWPADVLSESAAVLSTISIPATRRDDHAFVARTAIRLVNQAVENNQFAVAEKLAQAALAAVRKLGDREATKRFTDKLAEVRLMQTEFEKVEPAYATLQANPNDPSANHSVGRFECFWKNDWAAGLPRLAKAGGDPKLQAAATEDLQNPKAAATQLALADQWYEIGGKLPRDARRHVLRRAAEWYSMVLPGLAANQRTVALKRIDEAAQLRQAPPSSLVPLGLVAYWSFDEGAGRLAFDAVGKHHCVMGGEKWTEGIFGDAMRSAGLGDHAALPTIGSSAKWTVAMWVKLDGLRNDGGLFMTAGNQPGAVHLYFSGDSDLTAVLRGGTTSQAGKLGPGRWHHVTMRYDGEQCSHFIDGQIVAKYGVSGNVTPLIGPGRIGGWFEDDPGRLFLGAIDDVRLYGRGLTDEEILTLAAAGESVR